MQLKFIIPKQNYVVIFISLGKMLATMLFRHKKLVQPFKKTMDMFNAKRIQIV